MTPAVLVEGTRAQCEQGPAVRPSVCEGSCLAGRLQISVEDLAVPEQVPGKESRKGCLAPNVSLDHTHINHRASNDHLAMVVMPTGQMRS